MEKKTLSELEKDRKFKRAAIPTSFVYKNFLIVAPCLVIFVGLLGILFLMKNNLLLSYYSIFYIACFLLGTIWLKSIRQYIVNNIFKKENGFLTCWAALIKEDKKNAYYIFTTGNKRHDYFYIEKIKKNIDNEPELFLSEKIKHTSVVSITNILMSDQDVYITKQSKSMIKRRNPNYSFDKSLPLLVIDQKHVSPIPGRYFY